MIPCQDTPAVSRILRWALFTQLIAIEQVKFTYSAAVRSSLDGCSVLMSVREFRPLFDLSSLIVCRLVVSLLRLLKLLVKLERSIIMINLSRFRPI